MRNLVFSLIILTLISQNHMISQDKELVKVNIISDWDGASDKFYLGVRFTISPGWYIYWRNPGDAGLAPEIKLILPPSLKSGEIQFPIPVKIVHGDIVSFGYYNEVVLLIPIQVVSNEAVKRQSNINVHLNWLVCSESCIPGNATVEYKLKKASDVEKRLIKKYKDMLPKKFESSGLTIKNFKVEKKGNSNLVKIDLSGKNLDRVQDFYPDLINNFLIDLKSIKVGDGKIEMLITPTVANAKVNFLSGIVVINGEGYELNLKQK